MASFRGTLEGPRWAGAAGQLRTLCWQADVDCTIEEEKSFLRTTIRFELVGDERKIRAIVRALDDAIEQYNAI